MILLEGVRVTTGAATLPAECHISLVPGVLCAGRGRGLQGRGRGRCSRVVMVSCDVELQWPGVTCHEDALITVVMPG